MLILVPKCCTCKELSNDILGFGISSIQAKIKPKHQKYLHLILTEIVVLHFIVIFTHFPHEDSLGLFS